MNEERIENKFNRLIESLSDEEFWSWVGSWLDVDMVRDIYDNWDTDLKLDEIENLEEIIKQRKEKNAK